MTTYIFLFFLDLMTVYIYFYTSIDITDKKNNLSFWVGHSKDNWADKIFNKLMINNKKRTRLT